MHVTVYLAEHTHIFKEARVIAIAPLSVIDVHSICIKLEIHNCSQLGTVCKARLPAEHSTIVLVDKETSLQS